MDFFERQEKARSGTKWLVVLLCAAVALTVLTVYVAIAALTHVIAIFSAPFSANWLVRFATHFSADGFLNWELLGWVFVIVMSVILLGSGWKARQLSVGGGAVAELLGGRLLDLNSDDPDERRLLNIVEEMAIASGLPAPDVYVLDEERGINAFAAGNHPSDAVIAVTFGALKLLTRDEMQGVIAHEFSHILNGDMRLNHRLIGWLHGILGLVIIGRILTWPVLFPMHASARRKESGNERSGPMLHPLLVLAFLIGSACYVAGLIGAFFARLIKSAVSRQREYLADASAVQFTRNPDGIAGALVKVGGLHRRSVLESARAEEASHLFFSDGMGRRWFKPTATHPPLEERIRRINPQFDGTFPRVSLERVIRESRITEKYRQEGARPVDFERLASIIGASAAANEIIYAEAARKLGASEPVLMNKIVIGAGVFRPEQLEYAAQFVRTLPAPLRAATREPFSAAALVYGMVSSREPDTRTRQLEQLDANAETGIAGEMRRLLPLIDQLDERAFLSLVDLCLPALRQLSAGQYEMFRANLQRLVEEDEQIDLFEYMLERMLVRHLDPHFRPAARRVQQYYVLRPLLPDCAVLLSGVARTGHDDAREAEAAFLVGAAQLEPNLRFLPLAECNLAQIDSSLQRMAEASPRLRLQILDAVAATVACDGKVQRREAELLRAIADALDAPIPPLVCSPQLASPPSEEVIGGADKVV